MDRLTIIKKLVEKKKTYREIGEILDISKQRVHQIYKDYQSTLKVKQVREIKKEQGNKCALCGRSYSLELHHINGIKRDNRKDNLICLCRECHCGLNVKYSGDIRIMFTPEEHKKLKRKAFDKDTPLRVYCRELILKGQKITANKIDISTITVKNKGQKPNK